MKLVMTERMQELRTEMEKVSNERADLLMGIRKIQAQLSVANKNAAGYAKWREHAVHELGLKEIEQKRLKAIFQGLHEEYHAEKKRSAAVVMSEAGQITDLRKRVSAGIYDLCELMKQMEQRLKELVAENNALREKIGRMELETISAPLVDPSGEEKIDAWRDETK